MNEELSNLLALLRQAISPEQVFGPLAGDAVVALRRRFRELAAIAHPDRNPGEATAATEAFRRLKQWQQAAQQQIAQGSYGRSPRLTVVGKHAYMAYDEPLRGDLCDLYAARAGGEEVLLKIARSPRNADLIVAEAEALHQIARALDGQPLRAHFPTLLDHFVLRDAANSQRAANVLHTEQGVVSLADLLRAYPGGIDAADAAWIFNRMLAALGLSHSLGLVHGAVLPPHILIRPADHNAILIDWCYSVAAGRPLAAISRPYEADYPPEVLASQPATPASDLYMAARCMLRLIGGDPATGTLPARVPRPITALLRACLIPAPQRRAGDAWQLFDDFRAILREVYGPPQFRPFPYTVGNSSSQ